MKTLPKNPPRSASHTVCHLRTLASILSEATLQGRKVQKLERAETIVLHLCPDAEFSLFTFATRPSFGDGR